MRFNRVDLNITWCFNADIHILFITNERYLTYYGVCIFSIINKNPALNITFHLFSDEYKASYVAD